MEYMIIRSQKEIDDLLNECVEREMEGNSKFPGMSYEKGIQAAIMWLTEEVEPQPLED